MPARMGGGMAKGKKMVVVQRAVGDLKPADYNPRKLSEPQRRQIEESLKRFGFVDPVIVNTYPGREGVIVGGHQRCKVAKALGFSQVPCVEVWLSLEQERELNVRLNKNTGEWDIEALREHFEAADLKVFGFDDNELKGIFITAEEEKMPTFDDLGEKSPKLQAFIDAREKSRDRGKDKSEVNFWLCMVFQSHAQKVEFLGKYPELKTVYGMYCDGEAFAESIGAAVTPNTQKPVANPIDKELSGMVMP